MQSGNIRKEIFYISIFVILSLFLFNALMIFNALNSVEPTVKIRNDLSIVFNSLFSSTILLSFYFTIKKNLNILIFSTVLIIGYIFGYFELFDKFHYFLVENNIHPLSIFKKESLNVQITKTIFSIIGLLCLLLSFIKINLRSFDKKFYTLIISVVLITTYMFHYITAHLLVVQDNNLLANMVNIVIKDNVIDERVMSEFGVSVFKKEINQPLESINKVTGVVEQIPESLKNYVPYINQFFVNDSYTYHRLFFNNEPFVGNYVLLAKKKNNTIYYYILTEKINLLLRRDEIIFFVLSSIAQTIWLFGGFILFYQHKYRFKRKTSEKISEVK